MAKVQKNAEITATRKLIADRFPDVPSGLLPKDDRLLDQLSYTNSWIGGSIYIGVFMVGSSLVPPNGTLNLFQAILALLIGLSCIAVAYNLNGMAGNRDGIPFVVQTRSCFGFVGSKFPVLIRAVPALFWYGIQTWVGASALNALSTRLVNFNNIWIWFVVFQFVQITLSYFGFEGIKIVQNAGSIIIILSLIGMFYVIIKEFGTAIGTNIVNIPGTWGYEFWAAIVTIIGVMTAMVLNLSDYTREYHKGSGAKMFVAHWIGSVPVVMFMALIGLLAAGVTGEWDPIVLFTNLLPNSGVLVVALIFVVIAQVTTNVLLNVVPPTYILMDLFGLTYKKGALVTGLVVFLTMPWKIMNAGGFFFFINAYSMFLGPIFSVMAVDYWIIRKRKYDLIELYDKNGRYSGINWAGIITVLVAGAIAYLIDFKLAWAISLPFGAVIYYGLMKYTKIAARFNDDYHKTMEDYLVTPVIEMLEAEDA